MSFTKTSDAPVISVKKLCEKCKTKLAVEGSCLCSECTQETQSQEAKPCSEK